ncbi:ATP-dependent Clp protease proteolytic subunit [Maritalea porphyrae]|uniref:ATP-dependent Clp protease proteolytic subunit n=1 Tax=Maritalea porphyrae TaxID=880732 RepID=A0ABQ5USA0_9HYPH|nr:ATP-dependent Clp protease proteolytic subunit [Maritalea porphyrae]GLQ18042.1 ATP-dependent Clp protease proteolytic subunit [Maritalea porphyrae]
MAEEKDKAKDEQDNASVEKLLFKSRTVLITGEINDKLAREATSRLLALAEDNDDPINVFISSPGGHVESGDMVHDVIKFIKPTVRTIGSGWVASAGALIFIGAQKANRLCLPNTRFLMHQPSGGVGGQVSDIQIQADQIKQMRRRFEELFAEATGQTADKIAEDTKRDFWMNTDEALAYGLLGKVIKSADELK